MVVTIVYDFFSASVLTNHCDMRIAVNNTPIKIHVISINTDVEDDWRAIKQQRHTLVSVLNCELSEMANIVTISSYRVYNIVNDKEIIMIASYRHTWNPLHNSGIQLLANESRERLIHTISERATMTVVYNIESNNAFVNLLEKGLFVVGTIDSFENTLCKRARHMLNNKKTCFAIKNKEIKQSLKESRKSFTFGAQRCCWLL